MKIRDRITSIMRVLVLSFIDFYDVNRIKKMFKHEDLDSIPQGDGISVTVEREDDVEDEDVDREGGITGNS